MHEMSTPLTHDVLRPSIVGMRASMVRRTTAMHNMITFPPPPRASPVQSACLLMRFVENVKGDPEEQKRVSANG